MRTSNLRIFYFGVTNNPINQLNMPVTWFKVPTWCLNTNVNIWRNSTH